MTVCRHFVSSKNMFLWDSLIQVYTKKCTAYTVHFSLLQILPKQEQRWSVGDTLPWIDVPPAVRWTRFSGEYGGHYPDKPRTKRTQHRLPLQPGSQHERAGPGRGGSAPGGAGGWGEKTARSCSREALQADWIECTHHQHTIGKDDLEMYRLQYICPDVKDRSWFKTILIIFHSYDKWKVWFQKLSISHPQ